MIKTIKKFNYLLSKKDLKTLLFIIFFLLIGMILEIIGISLIVPLIDYLTDSELAMKSVFFKKLKNFFIVNDNLIIFYFLSIILLIFFLKTIVLVFINFKQNLFVQKLIARISNNLFSIYLNQSHSFFLKRNTASLIKIIQKDVNYFSVYFTSVIYTITETALLLAIIISVMIINPLGTVFSMGLFIIITFFFQILTRKKIKFWGNLRMELEEENSKITLESLKAYKEIKILNKKNIFINLHKTNSVNISNLNAKFSTINLTPRYFLEITSVFILVLFIIFTLNFLNNSGSIISTLGVFVAATFKSIPSINKIIASLQNFKFYGSAIDNLISEFDSLKKNKLITEKKVISDLFFFKQEIRFNNVSFKYSSDSIPIFENLNFSIKKGETIGVVGKSGSGKSTFIDLLVGLHKPNSGELILDSKFKMQEHIDSWRNNIGYIPQSVLLLDSSIEENIALGIPPNNIDSNRINEVLKMSELTDFISKLPNGVYSKVGEDGVKLSGGQRQRIGIARSLYNNPGVLILDEATSALDTETEKKIMSSIYKMKNLMTIIIVSHRLNTLKECNILYEVNNQQLKRINKKNL